MSPKERYYAQYGRPSSITVKTSPSRGRGQFRSRVSGAYRWTKDALNKHPGVKEYFRTKASELPMGGAAFDAIFGDAKGEHNLILPGLGTIPWKVTRSVGPQKIANKGSGLTRSTYTAGRNKMSSWVKEGQKYIYNSILDVNAFNLKTTVPYNGVTSSSMLVNGELVSASLKMFGGSGATTTPSSSSYLSMEGRTGDIYLKEAKRILKITSATNLNCSLRVYELVARKDALSSQFTNPVTAWADGVDAAFGVNSSVDYKAPGIYPGHSKYFRVYWAIDKVIDIQLAAGASHEHVSTYNLNYLMPNCTIALDASANVYAGVTRAYLFVLSSTPVHDSVTEANVNLGIASVDIYISQTLEYYGKAGKSTVINFEFSQDAVTTGNVIADADIGEEAIVN